MKKEELEEILHSKFSEVFSKGRIGFGIDPDLHWYVEVSRLGQHFTPRGIEYQRIIVEVRYYGQYVKKYELNYPYSYGRFIENISTWIYNRMTQVSQVI